MSIESSWLWLFNGAIGFFYFSHLKNCQVSPTEKIYVEPIYSQFTCLSVNLFRSEQFFKEQARDGNQIPSLVIFKIKFWDIELGNLVEHGKRLMYGNMMKDTTVPYHISYLVFDDCMVRWCRKSLIKHQEPRARSGHHEQWVDIQYLQFRTISTQYLHRIYTTQYPAETRQLLNSSWGYWREEAREQTDKIFMKVHRISKNLTLYCGYLSKV